MIKRNTPPIGITRKYIAAFVKVFVLAAFLVTAVQPSAFAYKTLKVLNNSGETVTQLFCVSTSRSDWGRDILSNPSTLPNGYYQIVNIPDGVRYVKVRAYFSGGRYKYWDSIDLNRTGTIKVTPYGR